MRLPAPRVGPYLRALAAAIRALAPNDDFPPPEPILALLGVLDPALAGGLLDPAEIDDRSGLPAFAWADRARAERALALAEPDRDPTPGDVARARALDAALADRLEARGRLRPRLRGVELPPSAALSTLLVRLKPVTRVRVTWDHTDAAGRWSRLRVEVEAPAAAVHLGPISVMHDRAVADPGLTDLLARHAATPLIGLRAALNQAFGAEVVSLCRGELGPFWFPGVPLPAEVPAGLDGGLLLHAAIERIGRELGRAEHADPWRPPIPMGALPPGWGAWRSRQFGASMPMVPQVQAWAAAAAVRCVISPIPTGR